MSVRDDAGHHDIMFFSFIVPNISLSGNYFHDAIEQQLVKVDQLRSVRSGLIVRFFPPVIWDYVFFQD